MPGIWKGAGEAVGAESAADVPAAAAAPETPVTVEGDAVAAAAATGLLAPSAVGEDADTPDDVADAAALTTDEGIADTIEAGIEEKP